MATLYIKGIPIEIKTLLSAYGKRQVPNQSLKDVIVLMVLDWVRKNKKELEEMELLTEEIKTFL